MGRSHGFDRLVFGNRFDVVFPSHNPSHLYAVSARRECEHGPSLGTTAPMAALAQRGVPGRGPWGVGYGAAGIIRGSGERTYRSRTTPQALLEVRLIMGDGPWST